MPSSFNPLTDILNLKGKVILITGGNAGIGAATIRSLAPHEPSAIFLCSRDLSAGEATKASILHENPTANIHVLPLDLSSFSSVKSCASLFHARAPRLDILFLNAGISAVAPALTNEGYEVQFGVNHMGHALLTQLLVPAMREVTSVSDPRIVVVSSALAHTLVPRAGLTLSAMRTADSLGGGMMRYGHSKLANILFANKLAQIYPGITTVSLHPGVVNSGLLGKADGYKIMSRVLEFGWSLFGVTLGDGAKTQLWCATADDVNSGHYYEPVGKDMTGKSKASVDQRQADELWEWTSNELARHGGPGWLE